MENIITEIKELVDNNEHSKAMVVFASFSNDNLLYNEAVDIYENHLVTGFITQEDISKRNEIIKKVKEEIKPLFDDPAEFTELSRII